jgi:HEAT repeat protein
MSSLRRLSEALWHGAPEAAHLAAQELARHGDPRAIPPLIGALNRVGVGDAAAEALASLGPAAVPALMAALRRETAPLAASVLARIGSDAEADVLTGVSSPNPQVRRQCLLLLPAVSPERADDLLWAACRDPDCAVRSAAQQTLAARGVRFSPDQLLASAARCPHGNSHVDVCGLAVHAREPRVRKFLRLLSPVPGTGVAAIRALAMYGDKNFVRDLLNGNNVVEIRQAAWVALTDRHVDLQRVAASRVLDISGATPAAVRAAAALGLGADVAAAHAAALVAIVDDEEEDADLRAECLARLKTAIDGDRLAFLCTKAFRSNSRRLRHVAVNTVPSGPYGAEIIKQANSDCDPGVRRAAEWRSTGSTT